MARIGAAPSDAPRAGDRPPEKRIETSAAQRPQHIDYENQHGERQRHAKRQEGDANALGVLKHEDDQRRDEHDHDRQIKPAHAKISSSRNAASRASPRRLKWGAGSSMRPWSHPS